MIRVVAVRPEQAEAINTVLRALAAAQDRADHLCAGVIVGLVPSGSRVLSAEVTGLITVEVPDEPSH